jgi:hypothetical protein
LTRFLGLIVLAIVSSTAAGPLDSSRSARPPPSPSASPSSTPSSARPVIKKAAPQVERLRVGDSSFVFGLILCLGLLAAATYTGVAAITGVFLTGMALVEFVACGARRGSG